MIHLFFERLLKTFSGYFRKSELTVQGGYAEIWRIAWPLVILSASNTIMMLTNRVFLAWNSPEEIAAAMVDLARHREKRTGMGENGYRRLKNRYLVGDMKETYRQIYRQFEAAGKSQGKKGDV